MTVPEDWCYSHGRSEPTVKGAYRVCGECFHVFLTEADLIADHKAEILRCLGPSTVVRATSGEQIWSCPHCIHDF